MSTKSHRAALLAVIGAPCRYCGQAMQIPDRPPSRDHIKPRSKGYPLAGNLALVCCRCNHDKGSLSLGQWLTRLSRAGDPRADHVETFMRTRGVEFELPKARVGAPSGRGITRCLGP
jgi:5-methylcytosine-specific restriction endonuclease McrA